jgi:hypothetical protein
MFDPDAEFALNRLRRRSEAIHMPEVANDRLKSALSYFGPGERGEVPLHWAEYIATLNNLCANEMVLGRFDAAKRTASGLLGSAAELAGDVLRRPNYMWSNMLLTEYLTGGRPIDLVKPFEAIATIDDHTLVDSMLLEINLATIRASAGENRLALDHLLRAFQDFDQNDASSPYVRHFATSNLGVLLWMLQDDIPHEQMFERAATALQEMKDIEYCHPFLEQRMMLLNAIFQIRDGDRTLEGLESKMRSVGMKVGPSWRFFGRPLLVTDIQYWADP